MQYKVRLPAEQQRRTRQKNCNTVTPVRAVLNDAAAYARHMFAQKQGNQKSRHDILESLTDIEVLNKARNMP